MEISILETRMGYNRVHDRKSLTQYKSNCIRCGTKIDTNASEVRFYGAVSDSQGMDIWNFEIIVAFMVYMSGTGKLGTDEAEVDAFMKLAYERAAGVFEASVSKDPFLAGYVLCPYEPSHISPTYFM